MIPWWVGLILLIVGIAIGITVMAICAGSWDKAEERESKTFYEGTWRPTIREDAVDATRFAVMTREEHKELHGIK